MQKTANEIGVGLVGSVKCIRDSYNAVVAADMSRESIFGIFSTILDYFLQQGFEKSIIDLKDCFAIHYV
jgi:hypothetical protein